jgi:hypothetical protein
MFTADIDTANLSDVKNHHSLVLYPSFGQLLEDGRTWNLYVHGVIFEPRQITLRKKLLLRMLRRLMKAHPHEFETELFQRRIRTFIAATERGKRVAVRIGARIHLLQKRSRRNGHFYGSVRLSVDRIRRLEEQGVVRDGWLHFDVLAQNGETRHSAGRCQLVGREGISVISDIDDTIKFTDVSSRRALLTNTFLREFVAIEGMAECYRRWAQQGAVFHYVSSSPWQLYDHLAELCDAAGFPAGSMHLRAFRLRDHMLRRMLLIRRKGKAAVIKSILASFPERRFVFVGDSAERDPEIYAAAARRFPRQTGKILIRQLRHREVDEERRQKLMRNTPPECWQFFESAHEIKDLNATSLADVTGPLRV